MKTIWITCGGCGYKIKKEWGCCPHCDSHLGYDIWKEFCKKNKLKGGHL